MILLNILNSRFLKINLYKSSCYITCNVLESNQTFKFITNTDRLNLKISAYNYFIVQVLINYKSLDIEQYMHHVI